ncbi:MAG: hypothetical protein JWM47_1854, partial [Acidimicrobiales bacterium]|nr:hypothetical protein [Acidimicrobiales bacterium]
MTARVTDAAEAARFDADGYFVRPLLSAGDRDALLALFESLPVEHGVGFTAALAQLDHAENLRVSAAIEAVVLPRLRGVVDGFGPIGATFLVKGSGEEGAMVVHQDWNAVDERVADSLTVWCPLADVGPDDGPLEVIPGSHRWFPSFRSPLLPSVQVAFGPEVDAALQPLPVPAGSAIVYSHALLHGSRQNRSGRSRIVVQIGMAPIDQPLVMCFPGPAETVELRRVEPAAFFRGFEFEEQAPTTLPGEVLATLPEAPLEDQQVVEELARRSRGAGQGT